MTSRICSILSKLLFDSINLNLGLKLSLKWKSAFLNRIFFFCSFRVWLLPFYFAWRTVRFWQHWKNSTKTDFMQWIQIQWLSLNSQWEIWRQIRPKMKAHLFTKKYNIFTRLDLKSMIFSR